MTAGFIDMVKAYDIIAREMPKTTLKGVPEAAVRMVDGTYKQ